LGNDLPDIQHSEKPEIEMRINQVGVQNVKAPFVLESRYGGSRQLVANVTMTTDLKADMKGISMSMLLRTLKNYLDKPLKHPLIKQILEEFRTAVETNSNESSLKFEFELPIYKRSPKTTHVFPQFYSCSFEGKLIKDVFRFFQKVKVQYASYCPCSASLCQAAGKGFPHAQRSFAEVLVEVIPPQIVWLEDIIDIVEKAVKTIPYPILQRVDEQEIARIAEENPMFVEDAIRRISSALIEEDNIFDWIVKCTHQESIHTSDAIAVCWKGRKGGKREGGFDGTYFL